MPEKEKCSQKQRIKKYKGLIVNEIKIKQTFNFIRFYRNSETFLFNFLNSII